MAETTTRLATIDISSILWFDATGTRKTLPITLKGGMITITEHFPARVETKDANDNVISVRDGAKSGRVEVKFDCDVFDAGTLSTEATFIDLLRQTGYVASTWTSTLTTQTGERKQFGLEIVIANRNSAGALKGGTYTIAAGDFVPPYDLTGDKDDGFSVKGLTWRGTVQAGTHVRTS